MVHKCRSGPCQTSRTAESLLLHKLYDFHYPEPKKTPQHKMEVVVCILTLSHTDTLTRLKWLVKMFKQNKTRLTVPKGSLCTLVKASGKSSHMEKKVYGLHRAVGSVQIMAKCVRMRHGCEDYY